MISTKRYSTAEPAAEPVTLAEAKEQLRIEHSDSDTEIAALISAARDAVEQYSGRYWASRDVVIQFETFPAGDAPFKYGLPDATAAVALTYIDADFAVQTIDPAELTIDGPREQVTYSGDWPTDGADVLLTLTVGADAAASPAEYVPAAVKQAILLHVVDLYENRATQGPVQLYENRSVMALLQPYRVNQGV